MSAPIWKQEIARAATFSPCGTYRYSLTRVWRLGPVNDRGLVAFVLLNPSTATETEDDPTIRRCQGFAHAWGYGGCLIGNLFAFRATDPKVMKAAKDPVGPSNDDVLLDLAVQSTAVVYAWGTHGSWQGRDQQVFDLLDSFSTWHLGLTKDGHPRHPLYLPKTTQLQFWRRKTA